MRIVIIKDGAKCLTRLQLMPRNLKMVKIKQKRWIPFLNAGPSLTFTTQRIASLLLSYRKQQKGIIPRMLTSKSVGIAARSLRPWPMKRQPEKSAYIRLCRLFAKEQRYRQNSLFGGQAFGNGCWGNLELMAYFDLERSLLQQ